MIRNTLKTTVLLATLGGVIVTVAGVLGGGSSTAHAYIHNPLAEMRRSRRGPDLARLFSTHPSTEDRIERLLGDGRGVGT